MAKLLSPIQKLSLPPIFIALVIATLIGVGFFAFHAKNVFDPDTELKAIKSHTANVADYIRDNINAIADKGGIENVLALTEKAFAAGEVSLTQCHVILHTIGHEAYERFPEDFSRLASHKASICIASFQHGVEGQIIFYSKSEAEAAENLKRYCSALRNTFPGISCYHGAGHGFIKKTLDNPQLALDFCDSLAGGPEPNLSDCYRGVFSEYANLASSYDGDTGRVIPGEPLVKLDLENPYPFCGSFAEHYRESCYSQLTKLHFRTDDIEGSFRKCLNADYDSKMQATCVRIVAGLYAEHALSHQNTLFTPPLVHEFPQALRKAYLSGAKLAFISFRISGLKKDWRAPCDSFRLEADRSFCYQLFKDFQSR